MTTLEAETAQRVRAIAAGATFLGAFGGAWLLWGLASAEAATPLRLAALVACCAGLVGAAVALGRSAPGPETRDPRQGRLFLLVNLVQWAAIAAAALALSRFDAMEALPATVSIIVALHFLPLAWLYGRPLYYATAAAMLALDAACLLQGGDLGVLGAMFGTGALLWATAALQLARGWREARASGP